jgi:hypothetical protein
VRISVDICEGRRRVLQTHRDPAVSLLELESRCLSLDRRSTRARRVRLWICGYKEWLGERSPFSEASSSVSERMFWDADKTQLSTRDTGMVSNRVGLSHSHSVPKTGAQIDITKLLSNQRLTTFQVRGQNRDVSGTDSPGQDVTFRIPDDPPAILSMSELPSKSKAVGISGHTP